MFLELESDNAYKKSYFEMLKYRLAYGSLELEGIDDDLAEINQSIKIYNQLSAINYVFGTRENDAYMNHLDFLNFTCNIASLVSGGEITDFRKTKAIVNGSKVKRCEANLIRNDLLYLIDDYNYRIKHAKTEKEMFEIEAMFHIRFLHIHPFEDANGRTARIILAYNLSNNNLAPCIISKNKKDEYCNYIESSDYKGLASMFRELSKKELSTMISLYTDLDRNGLIKSNCMTDEQEKRYKMLTKKL